LPAHHRRRTTDLSQRASHDHLLCSYSPDPRENYRKVSPGEQRPAQWRRAKRAGEVKPNSTGHSFAEVEEQLYAQILYFFQEQHKGI
jgi:hypothetical protein